MKLLYHKAGSTSGSTGFSETGCHVFVAGKLGLAGAAARQNAGEMAAAGFHGHLLCHELGHHLAPGHQIDERDVGYLDEYLAQERGKLTNLHEITHHPWHTEERRL